MTEAKQGDTVRVHYTGRLQDGTVFDTSLQEGRDPLEFSLGSGMVIPGFDAGVTGMKVGDKATVVIPPEDAYGEHSEERVLDVPREHMPEGFEPEPGGQLVMQDPDGNQQPVIVLGATETHVKLDANHVLAGKELTFDLELVEIV